MEFYPTEASIPAEKRTDRLILRPLLAAHVELDHDAVMSSAAQLRGWSQSDWPADDFTLAENLDDLQRHEREHRERVAFTFTVLDPSASRCLGCVYVTPVPPHIARLYSDAKHLASVSFWVRGDEIATGLDRYLLATLRGWLAEEWAFDRVVFLVARQEARQADLLAEAGLGEPMDVTLDDGRRCWLFG